MAYFHEVTAEALANKFKDKLNCRGILAEFIKSGIPIAQIEDSAFVGNVGAESFSINLREWAKRLNYPVKVVVRKPNVFLVNTKLYKEHEGDRYEQNS